MVMVRTNVVSTVTVVVVIVEEEIVPSERMLPTSEVIADQISPKRIERGERSCLGELAWCDLIVAINAHASACRPRARTGSHGEETGQTLMKRQ